jgi:hypothetical protein
VAKLTYGLPLLDNLLFITVVWDEHGNRFIFIYSTGKVDYKLYEKWSAYQCDLFSLVGFIYLYSATDQSFISVSCYITQNFVIAFVSLIFFIEEYTFYWT